MNSLQNVLKPLLPTKASVNMHSTTFLPGDSALVRNPSKRRGSGNLRVCWEDKTRVVFGGEEDNPVCNKSRIWKRELYSLLLPRDFFPLDPTSPLNHCRGQRRKEGTLLPRLFGIPACCCLNPTLDP